MLKTQYFHLFRDNLNDDSSWHDVLYRVYRNREIDGYKLRYLSFVYVFSIDSQHPSTYTLHTRYLASISMV